MKGFRLPRKIKKVLGKTIWLYPADENGNSLMAHPTHSQEDYTALKKGVVRNIIDPKNAKAKRKESRERLNKEIHVSDEQLKIFVNEIFAERYRKSSYDTLLQAKNSPKAVIAYYNFINAYYIDKNGEESYGNICCMAVDHARDLLKNKRR